MRILVVEDTAAVRARMVALIADIPGVAGVLEASGVAEAADALRAFTLDVMVLDLHLRDGSALNLLPFARRVKPGILVVVVTNHATPQHRRECLALGADHFFDKSQEVDELLQVVARAARLARDIA